MSIPHPKHDNLQILKLQRLRRLSGILDKVITIPGTSIHLGIDPILGIIPWFGDFLGLLLSSYIILEAAQIGVPAGILIQMLFNILVDSLIGTIPAVGDLFDVVWTANEYNIKLIQKHLTRQ